MTQLIVFARIDIRYIAAQREWELKRVGIRFILAIFSVILGFWRDERLPHGVSVRARASVVPISFGPFLPRNDRRALPLSGR